MAQFPPSSSAIPSSTVSRKILLEKFPMIRSTTRSVAPSLSSRHYIPVQPNYSSKFHKNNVVYDSKINKKISTNLIPRSLLNTQNTMQFSPAPVITKFASGDWHEGHCYWLMSGTHCTYQEGMARLSRVQLVSWLHLEMVYPSVNGQPPKY